MSMKGYILSSQEIDIIHIALSEHILQQLLLMLHMLAPYALFNFILSIVDPSNKRLSKSLQEMMHGYGHIF